MSEPETLTLRLFGSFEADLGGRDLPLGSATQRSVLAYLALTPDRREDRGRLAAMIWEASDDSRARQNLRQALHSLGRLFGAWDGLRADRTAVALDPGRVATDLGHVLTEVAAGRVPDGLLSGARLPEWLLSAEAPRGEMFDSWLRLRRRDYENRLRDGLTLLLDRGDPATARRAAEALCVLDPADERAVRHLIRDHHARGQTARALDLYEALWTHLGDEYDTEPGAETQALIARVKTDAPAPAPTPPARNRLRIVLAPAQTGGGTQAEGVARLFRADLMATLLRFRGFEVADADVTGEPGDYALDLTVGVNGEELLLLAVLTRRSDGVVIWSDRRTGLTRNWLGLQAGMVGQVASALSIYVSRARLQEIGRPEFGARAFDDWLLGNMELDRFRKEGWDAAAAAFRRVIDKAPDASMGYSSLARLNNGRHLMQPGLFRDDATHRESKELASQAVALDPLDALAHLHRAWACCLLGEYDQASAGFAMARACNANDPWVVLSSALGAAFSGEGELAQALSERAIAEGWTTQAFQWGFHTPIRFLSADYEGCVAAADEGATAIINLPAWKAAALWHLGREDEARTSWSTFADLARAGWTGRDPPDPERICAWFLSCFPVRRPEARRQMTEGASGAAGLQVHWAQQ